MEKQPLLAELNDAHRNLLTLVQDFNQADFTRPSATGAWTAKDVFAHLAFWNWEAKRAIEMAVRGEGPEPYLVDDAELDRINMREQQARQSTPLPKVMDDFRRSHKSLVALIERSSPDDLTRSGPHRSASGKPANAQWVAQTVIEHYREHMLWLEEYLERLAQRKE